VITGNQIRSARILASLSQEELATAAGFGSRDAISRMENYGPSPIVSRNSTTAAVLAALGSFGIALVPGGVIKAGTSCSI
jgi:transcriptional regulator with XRE-family HTH domain